MGDGFEYNFIEKNPPSRPEGIPLGRGTDQERSAIDQGCVRQGFNTEKGNTPLDRVNWLRH